MSHSSFIRGILTNYHDFTEKKVEESDEDVPLKFKTKS